MSPTDSAGGGGDGGRAGRGVVTLVEGNWATWKIQMKAYLQLRRKWRLVSGDRVRPREGDPGLEQWMDDDAEALGAIMLHVGDIYQHVLEACETAHDAWEALEGQFDRLGATARLATKKALYTAEMAEEESFDVFVLRVRELAARLRGRGEGNVRDWEQELRDVILMGALGLLHVAVDGLESRTRYDAKTGAWVTPTLDETIIVLREADMRRRQDSPPAKGEALLTHTQTRGKKGPGASTTNRCYGCGATGHRVATCPSVKCFLCQQAGHIAARCPQRHKGDGGNQGGGNQEAANCAIAKDESETYPAYALLARATKQNSAQWLLDSCCSQHIAMGQVGMTGIKPWSQPIYLGDNTTVVSTHRGKALLRLSGGDATVDNVLVIPDMARNLLSVGKLTRRGIELHFVGDTCRLIHRESGATIGIAHRTDNDLYALQTRDPVPAHPVAALACEDEKEMLEHRRFGHAGKGIHCKICAQSKLTRTPYPVRADSGRPLAKLDKVHTDVLFFPVTSLGGSRGLVSFIDEYTRHSRVYFISRKSECFQRYQEYLALVKRETGRGVRLLQADGGGEYVREDWQKFLGLEGTRMLLTARDSPSQNGIAERFNRTIGQMVRALLLDSGAPKTFWAEAAATAVYLYNRLPHSSLAGRTPHEGWWGNRPALDHLRVFGATAFILTPKCQRGGKLNPVADRVTFVGYSEDRKAWKFWRQDTKRFLWSRDARFFETDKGFSMKEDPDLSAGEDTVVNHPGDEGEIGEEEEADADVNLPGSEGKIGEEEDSFESASEGLLDRAEEEEAMGTPRRSGRIRRHPREWSDKYRDSHGEQSRPDVAHAATLAKAAEVDVAEPGGDNPGSLAEAFAREDRAHWKNAVHKEYQALVDRRAWEPELIELPPGRTAVGCKWVLRLQRHASGEIKKYKARLVAKGFSQRPGLDFAVTGTYAPVVNYTTVRCMFAVAAQRDLEVETGDVEAAFLSGDPLTEEVYIEQPEGYESSAERHHLVYRLRLPLYGLKQAACQWAGRLKRELTTRGYRAFAADECAYTKLGPEGREQIWVLVWVDDFIFFGTSRGMIAEAKEELRSVFKMTDSPSCESVLGIRVTRDRKKGWVKLDQQNYLNSILRRFGMEAANGVATPTPGKTKGGGGGHGGDGDERDSRREDRARQSGYRELVGALLHAAQVTRPDIAFAVGRLARKQECPTGEDWADAKRVLRYIKGSLNLKLCYHKDAAVGDLVGYSDADFAECPDSRRSTSGHVYLMAGGAIVWGSKRQGMVTLSTTEAEYVALTEAAKTGIWLRRLLGDVDMGQGGGMAAVLILEDNHGAALLAIHGGFHQRTKHIDVKWHYIRERVVAGEIVVRPTGTEQMVADVLTKGLGKPKHLWCTREMGLIEDDA